MKHHYTSPLAALLLAAGIACPAAGQSTTDLTNAYFGTTPSPALTPQEEAGLGIARRWEAGAASGMKPVPGPDGSIRFVFGATQPSIVCAVLQVCDLALQAGEQVNSIHLGDTARWTVEPAITGQGAAETQHLIIKPLDVGLETSMIITTDRRTYHIKLKSHRTQYMPQVAFTYPEVTQAIIEAGLRRRAEEREAATIPATGEYLGNLDFGYEIDGDARWKPSRIYNDGRKTIIELPDGTAQTYAPALLILNSSDEDDTAIVNYRVQGTRYIVDALFDRAILISGVGSRQEKVVIARSTAAPASAPASPSPRRPIPLTTRINR